MPTASQKTADISDIIDIFESGGFLKESLERN